MELGVAAKTNTWSTESTFGWEEKRLSASRKASSLVLSVQRSYSRDNDSETSVGPRICSPMAASVTPSLPSRRPSLCNGVVAEQGGCDAQGRCRAVRHQRQGDLVGCEACYGSLRLSCALAVR